MDRAKEKFGRLQAVSEQDRIPERIGSLIVESEAFQRYEDNSSAVLLERKGARCKRIVDALREIGPAAVPGHCYRTRRRYINPGGTRPQSFPPGR